jgi:hypothetical protein
MLLLQREISLSWIKNAKVPCVNCLSTKKVSWELLPFLPAGCRLTMIRANVLVPHPNGFRCGNIIVIIEIGETGPFRVEEFQIEASMGCWLLLPKGQLLLSKRQERARERAR